MEDSSGERLYMPEKYASGVLNSRFRPTWPIVAADRRELQMRKWMPLLAVCLGTFMLLIDGMCRS
jgi:hypothetical protein